MKCTGCNAEIDEHTLICPYCGAENEELARHAQAEEIQYYKDKTRELKKLPDRVVKASTKWILRIAAALLAVFVIVFIVVKIINHNADRKSVDKLNNEIAVLEEYYQSGNYEKMSRYLDSLEYRGASFEKYRRVAGLNDSVDWRTKAVENEYEYICCTNEADISIQMVAVTLEYVVTELVCILSYEEEGYLYGEGQGCEDIKTIYYDCLNSLFGLSETDIDIAVEKYGGNTESLYDLAQKAVENVKNK
ncbi:MAG: hypothetical protein ACI4EN_09295 [Butyrivibrio sp.]